MLYRCKNKDLGGVMKKSLLFLIAILMIFTLFGCKQTEEKPYDDFAIRSIGSYDSLAKIYKERQLNDFWRYSIFGKDYDAEAILEDDVIAPTDSETSQDESSETNTQVVGVDEDDTVKNDGRFIYAIREGVLIVLDSNTNDFVKYEYDDYYAETMYLLDGQLILLGRSYTKESQNDTKCQSSDGVVCPEYDIYYWYSSGEYSIKIFDVSAKDLDEIVEVRTMSFVDSYYMTSRVIDNYFYLILSNYGIYDYDKKEIKPFTYYDSIIGEDVQELPGENVFLIGNEDNIYSSYTILIGVDVTKQEKADINAYVGYFNNVYSSKTGMYVANVYNTYAYTIRTFAAEQSSYEEKTFLYRFEYDGEKIAYQSFNYVDGYIKDQFSMDEYEDVFRVAVTINQYDSATSESFIYAYDVSGNKFELIDTLGGIGTGEKIYSVRFEGDRAYIVTFRSIDPFYVIDVADPSDMKILGELKLPGVSDYLHPITDTLKLGIGRMTEENQYGSTVSVGLKITLFDVTDENNPIDVSTFELRGASSDIAYNHKALITLPSKQIYALPVYNWYDYESRQGMYVMSIDVANKEIVMLGTITHPSSYQDDDQWYSYYNSIIDKGVIINGKIYCISNSYITVNELTTELPLLETIKLS